MTRLASNYTPAHVQAINAIIYKNIGTQDAVKYIYMPGDPSAWDSFATWDKSSVPYRLTGLDFSDSGLTGEMEINGINTLTSLDVSGNAGLLDLNCSNNDLEALDVSGCTNLDTLTCGINRLSALNLSGLANLKNLACEKNDLDALDLSDQELMENLGCSENDIQVLDVSGMAALETLFCRDNALSALLLSNCAALVELDCSNNSIENLDASNLGGLKTLFCMNNGMQTLNISGCSSLERLECANNELAALDTENFPDLTYLNCGQNPMNSLALPGGEILTVNVLPVDGGTVKLGVTNDIMQNTVVTLTATAESGYIFSGWSGDKNGTNTNLSFDFNSSIAVTANFAELGPPVSMDAQIYAVAGQSLQNVGQQAGTNTNPITATVTVASNKASITAADIETDPGATVNLYADSGFSVEEAVTLNGGGTSDADTDIYVKVTAEDTITILYYKITVTRTAGPYAAVANVTVNGITGTALTAQSATITLGNGAMVYSGFSGIDAGGWFGNLPAGLTATASATGAVTSGSVGDTITIAFGGTPAAASSAAFDITIPAGILDGGQVLAVTPNSDAKFAITEAPPIGTEYTVIEHFGTFTGSGTRTASVDAAFGDFSHLEKDGTPVEPAHYEVSSGSTVITLAEGHMLPLDNGTHTYRAVFAGGYADLTLTVAVAPPDSSGTSGSDSSSSSSSGGVSHTGSAPKTGDTSVVGLWLALLGLSALGLGGVLVWCRTCKYKAK